VVNFYVIQMTAATMAGSIIIIYYGGGRPFQSSILGTARDKYRIMNVSCRPPTVLILGASEDGGRYLSS